MVHYVEKLDTVEISSERDSLLRPVTIKEEVAIMQVGSSMKRKVQNPISPVSQKQQTRANTREHKEGTP